MRLATYMAIVFLTFMLPFGTAEAGNKVTLKTETGEIAYSLDPAAHLGVPVHPDLTKRAAYIGKVPSAILGQADPFNAWTPAIVVLADGREFKAYADWSGYKVLIEKKNGMPCLVGGFRFTIDVEGATEEEIAANDGKVFTHDANITRAFRLDGSEEVIDAKAYRNNPEYRRKLVLEQGSSLKDAPPVYGLYDGMLDQMVYNIEGQRYATPLTVEMVKDVARRNPRISWNDNWVEKTSLGIPILDKVNPFFLGVQLAFGIFQTARADKGGFSNDAVVTREFMGEYQQWLIRQTEKAWVEEVNLRTIKQEKR